MGTITLPNFRVSADVKMNTRLKDGGVYIDWNSLTDIKVWLFSNYQKAMAGRCDVSINETDGTKLVCRYSSSKPQYLGVNKIIVQATYQGATKTYDKPVFNFVRWTADQAGEEITIDDPEVDVDIVAEDISSSVLDEATAAALAAADHAEHAASLVPLQILQDCEAATAVALTAASMAPVIGENGHWWVWNSQQAAYVDTGKQAKGDTGNGIASFSVVESQEDDADNVVTVTFTDGTTETFTVKNGKTGNGIASIVQTVESPDDAGTNVITVTMTNGTVITFNVKNGSKGQPGAAQAAYKSVETLPTASAETMDKIYLTPSGTSGVYNMSYTDYDGSAYSWVDLGTTAIQLSDYATEAELSQLEHEVNGSAPSETTKTYSNPGYIKLTDGSIAGGWIHSDIIPISSFIEATYLDMHSAVATIAFYSGESFSDYISGLGPAASGVQIVGGKATAESIASSIPANATHIAFSTESNRTLSVKTIQAGTDGLVGRVEDLEEAVEEIHEEINTLESRVDDLEGVVNGTSITEREEISYTKPGYIKYADGSIVTGNSWIHSDIIPISSFVGVTYLVAHSSVAIVAFYSGKNDSDYISGLNTYADTFTGGTKTLADIQPYIPANATHIAFSTDGASKSLIVTQDVTTTTKGLDERVSDIEGEFEQILPEIRKTLSSRKKMLHISFDDTISAFYDLVHNNRASIFDNAFFAHLKTLHDEYGVVFSCYCFVQYTVDNTTFDLSMVGSTYATEFSANSDWLKFGFHAKNSSIYYSTATAEEAAADYAEFITDILTITGSPDCVDVVPRLHGFGGGLNACRGMRNADLGVCGLLCADYSETGGGTGGSCSGYYLDTDQATLVWKKGTYYDATEQLHFYMSALRMDNIPVADMPSYMSGFLTAYRWLQTANLEMYCHENQAYNAGTNTMSTSYVSRLTAVCVFGKNNGFSFGYQMDKIRMAF